MSNTSLYKVNFPTKKLYLVINQNNYYIIFSCQIFKIFHNIIRTTTF